MAKQAKTADAFMQAVEQALERLNDPDWLGNRSPLAAPYFIGNLLREDAGQATPIARGKTLAQALQSASQQLGDGPIGVLNATFFQRNRALNNTGVARQLGMSEATYYRHRLAAIEALATAFNQSVVPPLRTEMPVAPRIAGRQGLINTCVDALRAGHSVSLSGISGIGKTAAGTAIAERWGRERAFWFTVLPGLNDTLSSFAFAFSHFLRSLGASNTWRQLAADHGAIDAERILGLVRYDLRELQAQPVLMCIDESDHLRPELQAHAQIIRFVESISKLTPALFMSQQQVFDADQPFALGGLSQPEMVELLEHNQVNLSDDEAGELHTATRGRPLLIKLFVALLRDGEPVDAVLRVLAGERSAEALFARLWKKLNTDERATLMALAVFDTPAPADTWHEHGALVERLTQAELAQTDGHGGLSVASHMRDLVLARIPADSVPALHLRAAHVREARGEFTTAARHYVHAGEQATAVWLWFNHRDTEIDKGYGPAALSLFRNVRQNDLPHVRDRRTLALIRAQLAERAGLPEEAETELNAQTWPANEPMTPLARELLGDALQQQGRVEQALERYRAGQAALAASPLRQVERLHAKVGYLYVSRLRDLDLAREESLMALSQAHTYCGLVREEAGDYTAALQHYQAALDASQNMHNNAAARAETLSHLGHLHMRMGNAEQAIDCLRQSIQHAQKTGEPVNGLYDALNLASAYIVAGRNEEARALAQDSLDMADAMRHAFLIAGLAACAAEACLKLHRLDEAEMLAMRSLQTEEEVHRPYALTTLGGIARERSQPAQAERMLNEAVASAQSTQDAYAEAHAWLALAEARQAMAQSQAECAALEHALTLSDRLGLTREAAQIRARMATIG